MSLPALLLALLPVTLQEAPRAPWAPELVEQFATLPVQDGGRVKPLDTVAQFQLLRLNGKRSFETAWGEKLDSTAWLMDCLFYPEVARGYRVFLVRDQAVLEAFGARVEGRKKSDRYSYDELVSSRERREQLLAEAGRIHSIEERQRSSVDAQLYILAVNVRDFENLLHSLDFAHDSLPAVSTPFLQEQFGSEPLVGVAGFLEHLPKLRERLGALGDREQQAEVAALGDVSQRLYELVTASSALALFPPEDAAQPTWYLLDGAVEAAFAGHEPGAMGALVADLEALARTRDDRTAFAAALGDFHGRATALARGRGEYARVPLEVRFYRGDYFTRALVFFLLAFVLVAFSWMAPHSRWLVAGVWTTAGLGTLFVVVGVVLRCIIRERPPVSTLYETILFITGCITIVCLAIEWMQRGRIALALAPILGAAGMFLAMKYELKEAVTARDTMPSLVAVLDTNFWLATHVTTITLGYAAGLLAAALGNLWLLGKMAGLKRNDAGFYRSISRMTYGVVCFGLIFSVVGTILGGVWANYSWGRFWGWDPKENGALLICLAELFILHARMGGYVREHGLAVLVVLNGLCVAFSWWHVNNLGVGLHSYGKTEGVILALTTYYGIGAAIVVASLLWRQWGRAAAPAPAGDRKGLPTGA